MFFRGDCAMVNKNQVKDIDILVDFLYKSQYGSSAIAFPKYNK